MKKVFEAGATAIMGIVTCSMALIFSAALVWLTVGAWACGILWMFGVLS